MQFENPDPAMRALDPGLNSRIYVKGANSTTGVGQGIRLNACHISEFADFDERTFRDIVEEDMKNALVESDPNTFAILESTAKGANRGAHKLWRRCVERGEEAEWYPLFLPWFFEASRVRVVMPGWQPEKQEFRMRERVLTEWVRCDNKLCRQYHLRFVRGEDRSGARCITCEIGTVSPYTITDQQLAWMEHRRKTADRDDESLKKLRQEQASSGEEAFQVTGFQIFGARSQEYANSCVRPPIAVGDFDTAGKFHGCNTKQPKVVQDNGRPSYFPCFQEDCYADHTHDDAPCQIWEWPTPGVEYVCGADIAEGLGGKGAYSVGVMIRTSQSGGGDAQVATWRWNELGPIQFAAKLASLGKFYYEALMCPECNKYDIVLGQLRQQYNYGNLYRWKHLDSINMMSGKLGWYTNVSSRPRLWQTFKSWLNQECFLVRSANLAEEMKNFTKDDEEDNYASGDRGEFDDELMACMIALYCAHETDYNDQLGLIIPKSDLTKENAQYIIQCLNCKHSWPSNTIEDKAINPSDFIPEVDANKAVTQSGGSRCPTCGSRSLSIERNGSVATGRSLEDDIWREATMNQWTPESEWDRAHGWQDEHI
jgi:ssDNA-binding Zn-finger/Zn-ribbon topoisomerase 1